MNSGGDVNATLKDLTTIFERNTNKVRESLVDRVCSRIKSEGAYEKLAWPSAVAQPRKFQDQKVPHGVDVNAVYTLNNETYELTLDFERDLLADGKIYGLEDIVEEAATAFDIYPDEQLSSVIEASATAGNTAYDGNVFHGDTHLFGAVGANNIDNKLAGTGTTDAQLLTDFYAAIAALRKFKDNAGHLIQKVDISAENLIVHCPAELEGQFDRILNAAFYPVAASSGASESRLKGKAELRVDGLFTDANDWYLHMVGMARKPYVFLDRAPVTVKILGTDSEFCANTRKVRIAAERRFKIGYGAFYRSIKTVN